jgi:hypothetical protein
MIIDNNEIIISISDLLALGEVTIERDGKKITIRIDDYDYEEMRRSEYLR